MTLPVEQWVPGLTVTDGGGRIGVLQCRGSNENRAWLVKQANGSVMWIYDDEFIAGKLAGVCSYASLGRSPVEGERAVCLADGEECVLTVHCVARFDHPHGLHFCYGRPSNIGFDHADRHLDIYAPLSPAPEEADEEQEGEKMGTKTENHGEWVSIRYIYDKDGTGHVYRDGEEQPDAKTTPPSPSGCLRVAAAREEFDEDYTALSLAAAEFNRRIVIEIAGNFFAAWRPRLPEFEPCGDCSWCSLQADIEQAVDEADELATERERTQERDILAFLHAEQLEGAACRRDANIAAYFGWPSPGGRAR